MRSVKHNLLNIKVQRWGFNVPPSLQQRVKGLVISSLTFFFNDAGVKQRHFAATGFWHLKKLEPNE